MCNTVDINWTYLIQIKNSYMQLRKHKNLRGNLNTPVLLLESCYNRIITLSPHLKT